jgi:nitroreductase
VNESCLDVIFERRGVELFEDREIPKEDLDKVLHAALQAPGVGGVPTSGYRGAKPLSIIVVKEKERREQLNQLLCDGKRRVIEEAPVSLVFCVDAHRLNRWARLRGGVPHFTGIGVLWVALRAVYTAAQTSVIAGDALGLGSQYIQEIAWAPHTTLQFFKLPKQVMPVAMIVLGYPAKRPNIAPTLPIDIVAHDEVYRDPPDDELLEGYAAKEQFFQEWRGSLPEGSEARKVMDSNGIETLAQYMSLLVYTSRFYNWRDDVIRTNLSYADFE